jgi:hypothetical protein
MAGQDFRLDQARWFARVYAEFKIQYGVHIRAMLYLLVSQPVPVLMLNGKPFENTFECFDHLGNAARDARYLDLIPANAIVDRRNPAPTINRRDDEDSDAEIFTFIDRVVSHNAKLRSVVNRMIANITKATIGEKKRALKAIATSSANNFQARRYRCCD